MFVQQILNIGLAIYQLKQQAESTCKVPFRMTMGLATD